MKHSNHINCRSFLRAATGITAALTLWLSAVLPGFAAADPFKSGDVVCWVGDSITHGGSYHSVIQLFYATRFPDRAITYWNCGIGGDRASAIMGPAAGYRFSHDILDHKPTVATIMLGMNDINRASYTSGKGNEIEKASAFAAYETNMVKLIQGLTDAGSRVILIQPSIYEETAVLPVLTGTAQDEQASKTKTARPIALGANAALGICAAKMKEWSTRYHTGLVDFYNRMNSINNAGQKKDPAFTLVGPDRIHPGPVGHFVMAYAFLKDTGMSPWVAKMKVDGQEGSVLEAINCTISKVSTGQGRISFECLERALPFPVSPEVAPALALVPFMQELNQEIFSVPNLTAGKWRLEIDGNAVGEFSAFELSAGVNLAALSNTPQYQQALTVMRSNEERLELARAERDLVSVEYDLAKGGTDPLADPDANRTRLQKQVENEKDPKKLKKIKNYLAADPLAHKAADERQQAITASMRQAAQPNPHTYTLTLN